MRRQFRVAFLVVGVIGALLAAAGASWAQSGLGSVAGTVIDQTGGNLTGVTVRLVEVSTGATRTATTNEAGLFTIPAVPPGVYTITIALPSFKTHRFIPPRSGAPVSRRWDCSGTDGSRRKGLTLKFT